MHDLSVRSDVLSIEQFERDGYVVLEDFLPPTLCAEARGNLELLAEVPLELPVARPKRSLLGSAFFESMVRYRPLVDAVSQLLGDHFLFHHANGHFGYLKPGDKAKSWHHDFDSCAPWRPGLPMMIHALVYPAGVSFDEGCLAVVPGSHLREVRRHVPTAHGVGALEDEVEITGGPGLLVLANSATWHVKKATQVACTRHHFNISYCQSGTGWRERHEIRHLIWQIPQPSACPVSAMLFGELDSYVPQP